ncbi:MAG: MerR family transcriptional regulator [Bdellovibrionales bacterium]|nr:MerR family transcriptional regulator [Bdellovibrionales bacterium]
MEFLPEGENPPIVSTTDDKAATVDMPLSLVDANYLEKLSKIPDKLAFKIGEVAEILGVKQYVLRYWETEFEDLNPKKSGNNQRMYTRKNVETALMIQKLLHRDRFSIEGARKILNNTKHEVKRINEYKTISNDLLQVQRDLKRLVGDIQILKQLFK